MADLRGTQGPTNLCDIYNEPPQHSLAFGCTFCFNLPLAMSMLYAVTFGDKRNVYVFKSYFIWSLNRLILITNYFVY